MREVNVSIITDNIKEMCIEANHFLTDDMKNVFEKAVKNEESALGKQVLGQLEENLKIAGEDMIPICQDTGMAVVFINVGQDVHLTGGDITDAINEGVRRGYVEGYLRKSVVKDPIYRENTKDNTPAVIHFNIVPGDKVDITVAPKGFGSENMSRIQMEIFLLSSIAAIFRKSLPSPDWPLRIIVYVLHSLLTHRRLSLSRRVTLWKKEIKKYVVIRLLLDG